MVLDRLHGWLRRVRFWAWFTVFVRVLLALGFTPSGLVKLIGQRFTTLGLDTPVGFFFEALYRTGLYWRFIGACQLLAAILLLFPRTALLGAVLYLPLITNIFVITVAMNFRGTPFVTGAMLLGDLYLLVWDYERWRGIVSPRR